MANKKVSQNPKKKAQMIVSIICIALALTMFIVQGIAYSKSTQASLNLNDEYIFQDGSGTYADPYLISSQIYEDGDVIRIENGFRSELDTVDLNITFRDCTFEMGSLIVFDGALDITFEDCFFDRAELRLDDTVTNLYSANITYLNCKLYYIFIYSDLPFGQTITYKNLVYTNCDVRSGIGVRYVENAKFTNISTSTISLANINCLDSKDVLIANSTLNDIDLVGCSGDYMLSNISVRFMDIENSPVSLKINDSQIENVDVDDLSDNIEVDYLRCIVGRDTNHAVSTSSYQDCYLYDLISVGSNSLYTLDSCIYNKSYTEGGYNEILIGDSASFEATNCLFVNASGHNQFFTLDPSEVSLEKCTFSSLIETTSGDEIASELFSFNPSDGTGSLSVSQCNFDFSDTYDHKFSVPSHTVSLFFENNYYGDYEDLYPSATVSYGEYSEPYEYSSSEEGLEVIDNHPKVFATSLDLNAEQYWAGINVDAETGFYREKTYHINVYEDVASNPQLLDTEYGTWYCKNISFNFTDKEYRYSDIKIQVQVSNGYMVETYQFYRNADPLPITDDPPETTTSTSTTSTSSTSSTSTTNTTTSTTNTTTTTTSDDTDVPPSKSFWDYPTQAWYWVIESSLLILGGLGLFFTTKGKILL